LREARQADIRDREKSLINVIRIIERKTILVFLTKNSVLLLLLALAALFVMSDTACSDTYRIHAPKKEDLAFQEWMPEGRFFSVLVPSEWKRREMDLMREHDQYRVTMYAPGSKGMEYLVIEIAYYAEAVRTPERFIYDLMNPLLKPQREERGVVTDMVLSGRKAMSLEIKTPRFPPAGMEGKTIDTVKVLGLPC
jgi:hypothetical protein